MRIKQPKCEKCWGQTTALVFVLFVVFALLLPPMAIADSSDGPSYYPNMRFKRLLHDDGIGEAQNINAITAIIQDHHGYMWFGGESGVVKYNGVEYEIFQKKTNDQMSLSGSYVWDIVEDHDGVVWVATAEGLNRFNSGGNNFTRYTLRSIENGAEKGFGAASDIIYSLAVGHDNTLYIGSADGLFEFNPQRTEFSQNKDLDSDAVHDVYVDRVGGLWAGTENTGLYFWDPQSGHLSRWRNNSYLPDSLPRGVIRAIEQDREGQIWVGTFGEGLSVLNSERTSFKHYRHSGLSPYVIGSNNIWDIHQDKEGKIWIATDPGGLTLYDPSIDGFRSYHNSVYDRHSLISDKVRTIFDDSVGDLWVGVFPSGVNYFDKSTAQFDNRHSIPGDSSSLSNDIVLTIFKDSKQQLWVGTEAGLNLYDRQTKEFTQYLAQPDNPKGLRFDSVLAVEEHQSGDLWIGTWSGGAFRFNQESGLFKQYFPDPKNPNSIGDEYIWTILRDSKNRTWFGTERNGLSLYRPESDDFVVFRPDSDDPHSLSFQHVWALLEDSKNRLWVGTIDGLNLLQSIDGDRASFQHYKHDPDDDSSLSSNRIISLFEDSRGVLWVGTQDAGLNRFDPATGKSTRITVADGLPSEHISSILEDANGKIWLSTVNGIAMIEPTLGKIHSYSKSNGLVSNNFNRNASYLADNGDLYFGGSRGLSSFSPSAFDHVMAEPKIVLSQLKLFNHPVFVDSVNSPLDKPINEEDEIVLSSSHSMFSIEFFAVSYRMPHQNRYSYMLEGFDKDWNDVDSNVATYTNIDPGSYLFTVRAANSDGVWNTRGKSLRIVIEPPIWNTQLAYFTYFIVFLLSIWFFLVEQRKKMELISQKELNQKLLKVDRIKDAFLANTSHELRTPLNGIIGLAESLADASMGPVTPKMKYSLKMISTSGRRLSNLINDILDYSKLHEQKLDVQLKPTSLFSTVNVVVELLQPLVGTKNLKLINDVPDEAWVNADDDRLQQILLNLAGNAVKFTDEGQVRIFAEQKFDRWHIFVEDSGPGIPKEQLDNIFDVFTQLDSKDTREQGGTGLGLSISKYLVELHGSKLGVSSSLNEGSTFTFSIECAVRSDEEQGGGAGSIVDVELEGFISGRHFSELALSNESDADRDLEEESVCLLKPGEKCNLYTILIVDDDAVNRLVLSGILSVQNYTVVEAQNGIEALDILASGRNIDLVIMDVMMPKMSGYETCMRVRVNFPVHVLPILFLTAKHFNSDIIRGFVAGGSDFLKKPVSKHDILSRVSSHLSMLEIHRRLESNYHEISVRNQRNDREREVLDRMMDVINREIDFKKILCKLLQEVKDLLLADNVVYWQVKEDGSSSQHYTALESDGDSMSELCLYNSDSVSAFLKTTCDGGDRVNILEGFRDTEFAFVGDTFPDSRSAILMTICFERQVLGFITVLINDCNRCFSEETIATLNRLQAHVTSAIIKAKLLERLGMDVSELKAD